MARTGHPGSAALAAEIDCATAPHDWVAAGEDDTVTLVLTVDPAFVPSDITDGANADNRELGVQVFYAFLEIE